MTEMDVRRKFPTFQTIQLSLFCILLWLERYGLLKRNLHKEAGLPVSLMKQRNLGFQEPL